MAVDESSVLVRVRRWGSLCVVGSVLALLLAGVGTAADAQALTAPMKVGVLLRPYGQSATAIAQGLDIAKSAGAEAVTAPVRWSEIAGYSTRTPYAWGPLDNLVSQAQQRGMTVSVQVFGTPEWVHPTVVDSPGDHTWYPPRGDAELAEWSAFVHDLVARFGTRLSAYKIWNEPNAAAFWSPGPSPSEYGALLRSAYLAAKAVDPAVVVEFGGISGNDAGYLATYYREVGAAFPDAAANHWFFDRLDVHPYTGERLPDVNEPAQTYQGQFGTVSLNWSGLDLMRNAMRDAGDVGKQIRIGEYGASTTNTWMPAVSDQYRALMMKRALTLAAAAGDITELDWYAYQPNNEDGPEWAILEADGSPTATFTAMKQWLTMTAPTVSVTLPTTSILKGLVSTSIRLSLSSLQVTTTDTYIDGRFVATGTGSKATWDSRLIPNGTHQLMAVARTKDGSVWPSTPRAVTTSNPAPKITSTVLGAFTPSPVAGSATKITATLKSDVIGVVDGLVLAVRGPDGAAHDFPMKLQVPVTPTGSAVSFSGVLPAGAMTYWLASYQAGTWRDLTVHTTITVS